MAALAQHQADPATRANDMLAANPELIDHPAVAHALLSQPYGAGTQLGMSSHLISATGSVHHAVADGMQSQNQHASGFWGGLWHGVTSTWDKGYNWLQNNLNQNAENTQKYGIVGGTVHNNEPLVKGSKSLVGGLSSDANQLTSKGASVLTQGMVNDQNGHWSFTADPSRAQRNLDATLNAMKNDMAVGVNPFNRQSVWWLMPHMAAFAMSMARRRGWAYTMQYLAPYLFAGVATAGAAVGEGAATAAMGDSAPADAALSEAELAARRGALANGQETAAIPLEPRTRLDTPTETAPTRGATFKAASSVSNVLSKPLVPLARGLKFLVKPGTDLRLNAMYLAADQGISTDTQFRDLWKQTSSGIPVDENGKPMGNIGANVAAYLGAPTGGLSQLIADPINFYAQFIGADPVGAVGKVIGSTRTADSVGGIVGHFFQGMGIRTPEDVYRTSNQYARVRRAFEWMAAHGPGAIEDTFKGMFKGEAGRTILKQLGDAHTLPEVQKVWADMASGEQLTHTLAPSMSMYRLTKATFKYGSETFHVEDALAGTPADVQATAKDVKDAIGISPWPLDSANSAVANGRDALMMRARNLIGRAGTRLLHQRPMYFNEETNKMDGFLISRHSVGLAHAVGDQLTELGYPVAARAIAQDTILHGTPSEINTLAFNIYKEAMTQLVYSKMTTSALDTVKVAIERDIFTELSRRMGVIDAGRDGVMVGGPQGYQLSLANNGKNAAIDSTQLAQMHFPRTRDLKKYAKAVAKIADDMTHAQDVAPGVDRHLSAESIARRASYAQATLDGIPARLDATVGADIVDRANKALADAFDAKMNELSGFVRESMKGLEPTDMIGRNRAFANTFDAIRNNLAATNAVVKIREESNIAGKMLRSSDPMAFEQRLNELRRELPPGSNFDLSKVDSMTLDQLRGEQSALRRAMDEMTAPLQKESITEADLKAHIKENDPNLSDQQVEKLAARVQRIRARNPRFRNGFNLFVDGVNRYQSDVFVPMALFSAGWGIRVGTSEGIVNAFREGGSRLIESKLLTSIAKHETGKGFFSSQVKDMVDRLLEKPMFTGSYIDMQKSKFLTYPEKVMSSTARVALKSILEMRDLAGGTLHGIEKNLVTWTPRTERMFDRVVGALYDHAPGGLPMGVHSTGSIVTSEAMRQGLLVGDDGHMSTVAANRTYAGTNADNVNYTKSLRHSLIQLHEGEQMRPGVDAIYEATRKMDLTKPITQKQADALIAAARDASLAKINSMSESELSAFTRHFAKGDYAPSDEQVLASLPLAARNRVLSMSAEEQKTFFAHYDWANTLAYHDFYTVTGNAGNGMLQVHGPLLEMAHSGNVAATPELQQFIDKLPPRTEPTQVVTELHKEEDAKGLINRIASQFVRTDVIRNITDAGFRRFLGPMVNALVRDPVYLTMYDNEMERMQPLVDKGLLTENTQKITAYSNAVVEMSKFVHNPLDRTAFESAMRVLSPFYFAQNQAWRRVMRVAESDPGAAEKYLKASLLMTNYVSVMGTKGNSLVTIPQSQWFSNMSAYLAHDGPFGKAMLGGLDLAMGAWVSSLNSILPTGSEAGIGVLENIVRPSAGPLLTTTVKVAEHVLGFHNIPYVKKIGDALLGPIGANTSLVDGLFPSAFFRNLTEDAALAVNQGYSATASIQAAVETNAVENLYMQNYDAAAKELGVNGLTGAARTKVEALARSIADTQTTLFLQPGLNGAETPQLQKFVDQIHAAATILATVKTALSMGSPFALSLQKTFSDYPGFQKIMDEKLPNGQPKYTFEEAASLWTQKDPGGMFTLLGSTMNDTSSYPETKAAADLLTNHPYIVKTYPAAAAYLPQRNGPYDPAARQLELSMHLRSLYNLSDTQPGGKWWNQMLVVMGNDQYYNHMLPNYQNPDGTQTYEQYKALTKAVQNYVNFVNPTWGSYMNGKNGKWMVEVQAVTEMKKMLNDPNVPSSVFGGTDDENMYRLLLAQYDAVANEYTSATSSTQRFNIEQPYYQKMTALAKSGSLSSALSYFVSNVLANLPTAKELVP